MDNSSPPPSADSTHSSLERTHLAASRTLLALIRTGSVIAGGGALATDLLVKTWPRWVVLVLSTGFILLGYWMMWVAVRKAKKLRARLTHDPQTDGFLVTHVQFVLMTVILQILIALVVVLYLFGG